MGHCRSCPIVVGSELSKGTGMQSSTDAHTEVPAVGGKDIWKHSFHWGKNMATCLGHREELTLKGLPRDQHIPAVGGHTSNPAVKLVWRASLARQEQHSWLEEQTQAMCLGSMGSTWLCVC